MGSPHRRPFINHAWLPIALLVVLLASSVRNLRQQMPKDFPAGRKTTAFSAPIISSPQLDKLENSTISHRGRIIESIVLSLDFNKFQQFEHRNAQAGLDDSLSWFMGVDGFQQRTLDQWAKISNKYPPLNASVFGPEDKGKYASPHAVGCYLSHWNVLRSIAHRNKHSLPDAVLILEDDASCAPNLTQHLQNTLWQLPDDWDILYVGGKPITYFRDSIPSVPRPDASTSTVRRDICRGDFGRGQSPTDLNGSRKLDPNEQVFWRTTYMANTDAYIVNPRTLRERLIPLLKPRQHIPIDIRLGNLMDERKINAYMTTLRWCTQESPPAKPEPWEGLFAFHGKYSNPTSTWRHPILAIADENSGYVWQNPLHLENCTY